MKSKQNALCKYKVIANNRGKTTVVWFCMLSLLKIVMFPH